MASIKVEEPMDNEEQKETTSSEVIDGQEKNIRSSGIKNQINSFMRDSNRRVLVIFVVIIALLIGYTIKTNNEKRQLEDRIDSLSSQQQETASNQEGVELKEEVSQVLELPSDEVPTVATVVDASKVRDQPFFKNAQNGDKVLIFATSGKAVLYRPEVKKVIEVAPVNLGQNQEGTEQ